MSGSGGVWGGGGWGGGCVPRRPRLVQASMPVTAAERLPQEETSSGGKARPAAASAGLISICKAAS